MNLSLRGTPEGISGFARHVSVRAYHFGRSCISSKLSDTQSYAGRIRFASTPLAPWRREPDCLAASARRDRYPL